MVRYIRKNFFFISIFAAIILLGLYLRFLILKMPLSVDEGLWGYIASILLKGKILYRDIYSISLPVLYFPFMVSEKILGHGLLNLRIFGVIWNLVTIFVIFLLARKIFGKTVGFISLAIAFLYTVSFQQEGHFLLLAEHLSQLPIFLSLILLVSALSSKKKSFLFFLSGVFLGFSWNMREHYLVLQILLAAYLILGVILRRLNIRQLGFFLLGSALPFIAVIAYFYKMGTLPDFLNAVFIYRSRYMTSAWSINIDYSLFTQMLGQKISHLVPLMLLSFISLYQGFSRFHTASEEPVSDAVTPGVSNALQIKTRWVYEGLLVYVVLLANIIILITTGSRLFNHYFIYLAYGLLIPSAIGLDWLLRKTSRIGLITTVILTVYILLNQSYSNIGYLANFNKPIFGKGILQKNLIVNPDLQNYLKSQDNSSRILFLGESRPNFYYLNRDFKEKFPQPLFFVLPVFYKYLWPSWFADFKTHPAKFIVEDFGIPDILQIEEFKEYVRKNYVLDRKINQDYILKLKSE